LQFDYWDFLLLRASEREIPLFEMSNYYLLAEEKFGRGTVSGGQFNWDG